MTAPASGKSSGLDHRGVPACPNCGGSGWRRSQTLPSGWTSVSRLTAGIWVGVSANKDETQIPPDVTISVYSCRACGRTAKGQVAAILEAGSFSTKPWSADVSPDQGN